MLLSEPGSSPYDIRFRLGEFPIRIHPYFWLTTLLLGPVREPPVHVLMWMPAVIISILVHELGHALAFRSFGIGSSIVLYAMGGLTVPSWARARSKPLGPWEYIVVSLAGPFIGFALGAAIYLALRLMHCEVAFIDMLPWVTVPKSENVSLFCEYMLYINIYWGLLNLLPIFPLDGGQVSQQMFHIFYPQDAVRQCLILSIAVAIGMILLIVTRSHSVEDSMFKMFLFGMLAWQNYITLQSIRTRNPWR